MALSRIEPAAATKIGGQSFKADGRNCKLSCERVQLPHWVVQLPSGIFISSGRTQEGYPVKIKPLLQSLIRSQNKREDWVQIPDRLAVPIGVTVARTKRPQVLRSGNQSGTTASSLSGGRFPTTAFPASSNPAVRDSTTAEKLSVTGWLRGLFP